MTIKPFVDRPKIDIGQKITVIPATEGMDTSKIDSFRQGVSIRDWSDFGKSLLPFISDRGFPAFQRERFDPSIVPNHFGQSVIFNFPSPAREPGVSDGPGPAPFNDIPGTINPVEFINNSQAQTFPVDLVSRNWLDPELMDGIIEPLSIRETPMSGSELSTSIVAHKIRGSLQPNSGPEILGQGKLITRFIEFKEINGETNDKGKTWGLEPWEDTHELLIESTLKESSFVFCLSEDKYRPPIDKLTTPFNDSPPDLRDSYIANSPGVQRIDRFLDERVFFGNFIDDPRFGIFGKSAVSGIEYRGGNYSINKAGTGNQLVNGTDSIAFGGLLK